MVDRGFICGVMVTVLAKSVVDRGFICGVMVSVLAYSVVDVVDRACQEWVHLWCNG